MSTLAKCNHFSISDFDYQILFSNTISGPGEIFLLKINSVLCVLVFQPL